MARVVVHEAEMRSLLTSPQSGVVRELVRRGYRVEARAKELARVDTGRMRASITTEYVTEDDEFIVQVGTNVTYAKYYADEFLVPALAAAF